ncbi:MAG: phosphoribosylanthranilate isomerase [Deltaproteobacteria bacterium]|nr:phosphoribosylanthranilate isomerase [Deltaproteobacteria bacterium]MBW1959998.1 phosphoribosylanthranilate isomerase [Deltaproteobacteria bacterium]MBW2153607.1 phosphoribosylanthranilate isomerase [Deltaproteobacteria bacterium]
MGLPSPIYHSGKRNRPQVKICGLTDVQQALACAAAGADAIGYVFYPKSPRFISEEKARAISLALPEGITPVGVFVNMPFSDIMQKVKRCFLKAVQLHGQESPELVNRLREENLLVIKALFTGGSPSFKEVCNYNAGGYLLECAGGNLPGGNALEWNWEDAQSLGRSYPIILAGGLCPDNISRAIIGANPDAVDVSSGVESRPGIKDIAKVKAFMTGVCRLSPGKKLRKIF